MPMRRPSLDDTDLWRRAVYGVMPLRNALRERDPVAKPPLPAREGSESSERLGAHVKRKTAVHPSPIRPSPPVSAEVFAEVDRRTRMRLHRGHYPVQARLDLHGMTQDEAHRALSGFIATARASGKRCVLVITGHGRLSGGVLKRAVPRWLAEPALRPHVLQLAPARPPHGGAGALYVLLRRAER
jgi:DNA-nicking Smr family endonuclease